MNKSNVLKAGIVSTVLLATVLGTNVKVFGATNDVIKDVKYVNSTLVDFYQSRNMMACRRTKKLELIKI